MKIGIIGANGQLSSDLIEELVAQRPMMPGLELVPLTHHDIEIADIRSVEQVLKKHKPDCVINTAAFHNVVMSERQPKQAFEINAIGAWNIAQVCEDLRARLVHISTDYVFDGSKKSPYIETDLPRPLNIYGISKLAGENAIMCTSKKYYIVRTSGLYGSHPCRAKGGENFVDLMLRLAREQREVHVVNDEIVTPTYTLDLAKQILNLINTESYGIFHATSHGECSWYDFAQAIFMLTKMRANLQPLTSNTSLSIKRPEYSVLSNKALQEAKLDIMRPWQEALAEYLK